jgi:hypothetical protein
VAAVKRAIIVLPLLLLLLAVLPLGMGMTPMADCPACAPTSPLAALGLCLAVLGAAVILAVALLGRRFYVNSLPMRGFLLAPRIDRPPQLV